MNNISVLHTSDGLRAYLQFGPGTAEFPKNLELRNLLKKKGIVFGLLDDVLNDIAAGRIKGKRIEVARGVPPNPGVPGSVEMFIDVSGVGKPRKLSNGRVDHYDIGTVINIKKGEKIARFIPPQPGTDGKSVFGKVIPAPPPLDSLFSAGTGTCRSQLDPNLLIAQIEGALVIKPNGIIEVKDEKIIEGDIDYSTGNVMFTGNLNIRGTIRSGFSVETKGDLKVRGNIEDAEVKCDGNLEVGGGAVGSGNGQIKCFGNIKVRHVENFSINVGQDLVVCEDVMHSTIVCGGKIKAKLIVGGTILAVEIEAETAGSNSETRTILDIGRKHMLIEERNALQRNLAIVSNNCLSLKNEMFSLVKKEMDDDGHIPPEQENKLESLKKKTVESINNSTKLKSSIEEIEKMQHSFNKESGISVGTMFPNTMVRYGTGERFIMEKIERFRLYPGKIARI